MCSCVRFVNKGLSLLKQILLGKGLIKLDESDLVAQNMNKALNDKYYSAPSGNGGGYNYGGPIYNGAGHTDYGYIEHEEPHHSSGHKKGVALSALTLLAFLFFLHILQTCLQEQMAEMTGNTQVVMITSRNENRDMEKRVSTNEEEKREVKSVPPPSKPEQKTKIITYSRISGQLEQIGGK